MECGFIYLIKKGAKKISLYRDCHCIECHNIKGLLYVFPGPDTNKLDDCFWKFMSSELRSWIRALLEGSTPAPSRALGSDPKPGVALRSETHVLHVAPSFEPRVVRNCRPWKRMPILLYWGQRRLPQVAGRTGSNLRQFRLRPSC